MLRFNHLWVFTLSLIFLLSSCIKNDLPYPRIPQAIREIACIGEESPAIIDSVNSTVTLRLLETTDIRNVRFASILTSPDAQCRPNLLEGSYDLSHPLVVTLSLYQDYPWIIKAEQTIERYLTVEGQIGTSTIDDVAHRVIVKVPESANLTKLQLTSIKLGPEGITTMVPDLQPGEINLSEPFTIDVSYHGQTEVWTIFAERTEQLVTTVAADAWSEVAWIYGSGPADGANTFEWRLETDPTWNVVPEADIVKEDGNFHVCLKNLTPLTDYRVRAVSGEEVGNELTFTTQATEQLPDADFNLWHKQGNIWYPYPEGGPDFWDTGNKGAATLGESNVVPSDYVPAGLSGQSAKLQTLFVGVFGIGKLAAGSIYTGRFDRIDGTNGILDFGRPWELRPTRLKGYFDYTTAPINYASTEYAYLKDRPDSCHIYIALTDWSAPYQIRTNPKNRQLFDPNSAEVIGYGELICGETTGGYREFTIDISYRSTSRRPRYIQITAAASKYGDFFTGGTGAVLYVDDFSLDYGY